MRFVLSDVRRELDAAILELNRPLAEAATAAVWEAGALAVREGRQQIASVGFSRGWQEDFFATNYPKQGRASLRPATVIRHRRAIASIFEHGAAISGKPFLFLPLDAAPRVSGKRQLTPRQYVARIGPLRSVNRPGKRPLLVGKGKRGTDGRDIPLYVGIPVVRIRKRFSLYAIIQRAADRLPELFQKNLKP